MNMDISFSGIMSGIIFGIIGFALFREGKKRANYAILFIGITLMIYPYFSSGPWGDWGIGALLCGAAYYFFQKN